MPNFFHNFESPKRRRSQRVTPDPFWIIHLPGGNQAVVLDICEGGVGFLASAPVEQTGALHLEISARSMPGAEAAGRLVWKDPAGKRGGLRFTHLPAELRGIIQACLAREQSLPTAKAAEEPRGEARDKLAAPFPPVACAIPKRGALLAHGIATAAACLAALAIWYAIDARSVREALTRLRGFVSPLLYAQVSHVPHGWTIVGEAPSTREARPADPPEAVGGVELAAPGEVKVPADSPATQTEAAADAAPQPTPPPPETAAPAIEPAPLEVPRPRAWSPIAEEPGETQLTQARKLLPTRPAAGDPAKAVPLLWEAIEKGNAAAAIELADLYLSGRGVAKSCEQALVLLTAARNRLRAAAEEKLRSFPQYGCELPDRRSSPRPTPDTAP